MNARRVKLIFPVQSTPSAPKSVYLLVLYRGAVPCAMNCRTLGAVKMIASLLENGSVNRGECSSITRLKFPITGTHPRKLPQKGAFARVRVDWAVGRQRSKADLVQMPCAVSADDAIM